MIIVMKLQSFSGIRILQTYLDTQDTSDQTSTWPSPPADIKWLLSSVHLEQNRVNIKVLNGHSAARLNSPNTELGDCPDDFWVSRSYPSQSNLLGNTYYIAHFIPSYHQSFAEINITFDLLSLHDQNKCFHHQDISYFIILNTYLCMCLPK